MPVQFLSAIGSFKPVFHCVGQHLQSKQKAVSVDTVQFTGRRPSKEKLAAAEATGVKEPSLAEEVVLSKLRYPVWVSPKIDGNRGMIQNGVVLGRGLDPIPNQEVQRLLGNRPELEGLDGELIASSPTDNDACRLATSYLRSKSASSPDFQFWVFDVLDQPDMGFSERQKLVQDRVSSLPVELKRYVKIVPQVLVNTEEELQQYQAKWVDEEKYEGLILKSPDAEYLHKRGNMTNQAFMKLKSFKDAEAVITQVWALDARSKLIKEMQAASQITPEQLDDVLNKMKALGGYRVRDIKTNAEFWLTPHDRSLAQRQALWQMKDELIGKVVKYKYFPVGMNQETKVPRHPVFICIREDHDMPADLKAAIQKPLPKTAKAAKTKKPVTLAFA